MREYPPIYLNMKRIFLSKLILLVIIGLPFLSCEVEKLTGDFPQENPNDAGIGQFVAKIGGQEFVADSVYAILSDDGIISISGSKAGGKQIILTAENAMEGNFDLTATESSENSGVYVDGSANLVHYISKGADGGAGEMTISQLDTENNTVSGTFSFKGVRIKIGDDGLPLLDGSGNPLLDEIQITNGAFNSIPVQNHATGNPGGDPGPDHEFFAKVDGIGFIPASLRVRDTLIADVHMLTIEAVSVSRQRLRIDIPRSLGEGSFEMEALSDGTKLIGLYKEGGGSTNLTSNPGSITITEFNLIEGVLKANFQFTANDPLGSNPAQVEITEGSFTLNFEGIPGADPLFTARIDGVDFNPDDFSTSTTVVNQYPRVTLSAQVNNQKIEISFPTTHLEGNYEFGSEVVLGNEVVGRFVPIIGTSISYISESGSLVITDYDLETGVIKGTFNFTASDPSGQDQTIYQITAGEFLIIL